MIKKFRYALGYNESTEVFPKQDKLKPNDFGSWINLSYKGGNSRVLINPEGKDLNFEDAMLYCSKRVVKLDKLSPYKLLADTKFIDSRNERLFRAKQFFKKIGADYEKNIVELNKLYDNPLDERELHQTILREDAKDYWENPEQEDLPKELIDYDVKQFLQLPIEIPLWIIKNLIRQETINFIVAPKGVGKSEFILGMLWAIQRAIPFLNGKFLKLIQVIT